LDSNPSHCGIFFIFIKIIKFEIFDKNNEVFCHNFNHNKLEKKKMNLKSNLFFVLTSCLFCCLQASECVENCPASHKSIFPITWLEFFGYLFFFFVTIITTVGGIGGGAFYLPTFMVFFGFTLRESIPLSITCVMGVLFVRFLLTIKEKHPRRDKPLINYEVCLIFSPSITVGTVFGVLLNKISPSWVILILVLFVLGSLGYKTLRKAIVLREAEKIMKGRKLFSLTEQEKTYLLNIYAKIRDFGEDDINLEQETNKTRVVHSQYVKQIEMNYIQKRKGSAVDFDSLNDNAMEMKLLNQKEDEEAQFLNEIQAKINDIERFEKIYGKNKEDIKIKQSKSEIDDDIIPPNLHDESARKSFLKKIATNLHDILEVESQLIPKKKIYLMLFMLVILIIISLIQGSRHFPSIIGIPFCSVSYWLIRFSFLPIGFGFLVYVVRLLTKEHQEKKESGYIFLKNDLVYDYATCLKISINGVFTGFASSVLGIGGAVFIGPLLLQLGLPPHESTYTASFSALFTAFSSFLQYSLTGLIKWDFAVFCTLIGICAMYIGLEVVLKYVKRMGQTSLIVVVLAFLIILSTILIIVSGVSFMIIDYNAGLDIWSFRPIC